MTKMLIFSLVLLLVQSLLLGPIGASGTSTGTAFARATSGPAPNPQNNAYYGDLHLHTVYSFDAYATTNITPDEAYRFARGEPVDFLGKKLKRSTPPLDFLAVTDHAENMGVVPALDDPSSSISASELGQQVQRQGMRIVGKIVVRLFDGVKHLSTEAAVSRDIVDSLAKSAWQREIAAANRNYEPGVFTTFIAYEWTSQPGMQNLHRNVIFRGDRAPLPFTAADSTKPEDLWAYLQRIRLQGYEALAIPHNANASNGLMFDWVDSGGRPIDQAYAQQRAANEPLVEIVQTKGQSETHPVLSPNDEFSGFEVMDFERAFRKANISRIEGSYVRDALGRGLAIAQRTAGVNPFKYGFVGASDLHTGLSEASETAVAAARVGTAPRLSTSREAYEEGEEVQLEETLPSKTSTIFQPAEIGSPGLTGVWAEQNTREAIFAALRRRETFATSGPRLKIRFFGGWQYTNQILASNEWLQTAYRNGVPMGGDLPVSSRGKKAPTFIVWALKDPDSANLDRLQIVKISLSGGRYREEIRDVALSNGRKADPRTGKAPALGNTVDVQKAIYKDTIGATELSAVWQDPTFNPTEPAVYYLRVLEIPTPRWSTIVAVKNGTAVPSGIPASIQERGWSSPIWYSAPAQSVRATR